MTSTAAMCEAIAPKPLGACLPGELLLRLSGAPEPGPAADVVEGTALIADIVRFMPLVEALADRGPEGVEELSRVLNGALSLLSVTVQAHGGEVLRFVGDGVLAFWSAERCGGPPAAAALAARCGLQIQSAFAGSEEKLGHQLHLRVAAASGRTALLRVGGGSRRWEFFAAGVPLQALAKLLGTARPGEVVVSSGLAALVPLAEVEEIRQSGMLRLRALDDARPLPSPVASKDMNVPPTAVAFVPEPARRSISQSDRAWLPELRPTTVVFAELGLEGIEDPARLEDTNAAVRAMQDEVGRFGGSVHQVLVDDKGTVAIAAWGLPGRTHEDDALRAVRAARGIVSALCALGVRCSAGVASGRSFCGLVGSPERHEYAIVGQTANRAARLMQAAGGDVLCDEETLRLTRGAAPMKELAPLLMKGAGAAVPVFRPLPVGEIESVSGSAPGGVEVLVGRTSERERCEAALEGLAGQGQVLCIEGDAGMGKSLLVTELLSRAGASGIRHFSGAADALATGTAYLAWRRIFRDLVDPRRALSPHDLASVLRSRLEHHPELVERLGLLRAVLPIPAEEGDLLPRMPDALRGPATRELLATLLAESLGDAPAVLVLDDAHWMDSASWALAAEVQARLPRLLLVLAQRPAATEGPEAKDLLARAGMVRLGHFTRAEVIELACRRLGTRSLPEDLADLLYGRSGGNPLFAREIISALSDGGRLRVSGQTCLWDPPGSDEDLAIPRSVEGIIASRLDRLTLRQKLTVKVAAAIGATFERRILGAVHPQGREEAALDEDLQALAGTEVIAREPLPDETFSFRHGLFREAAYALMPPSQRRALHHSIAGWMEEHLDGSPQAALLAHHWSLAGQDDRTVHWLEEAAVAALRAGATREVVRLLLEAVELDRRRGPALADIVDDRRRARWWRLMGDARLAEGDLARSRQDYDTALGLLGRPLPRSPAGWLGRLLLETARQVVHLLLPSFVYQRRRGSTGDEVAAICGRVAEQRFYEMDLLGWATCLLTSINAAESAGALPSAARGYGGLGYAAGLAKLGPLARRWFARGRLAGDLQALSIAVSAEGLHHMGQADWSLALGLLDESFAQARGVSDRYSMGVSLFIRGETRHWIGDLPGARTDLEALLEVSRSAGNVQQEVWALTDLAAVHACAGRLVEARRWVVQARGRLDEGDVISVVRFHGTAALVAAWSGDDGTAETEALEALATVQRGSPIVYSYMWAYTGMAEALVAAFERSGDAQALARATQGWKAVRAYARLIPAGRSRTERVAGTLAWLKGSHARARRRWARAIDLAVRMQMPLDELLTRLEWARRDPQHPSAGQHLEVAHSLAATLGCTWLVDPRHARGVATADDGAGRWEKQGGGIGRVA